MVWEARYDSGSFTFEAFARTRADALTVLRAGLARHGRQYRLRRGWWLASGAPVDDDLATAERRPGVGYRDGAPLWPAAPGAAIRGTTIWRASFETRHFDFAGYGATEADARAALLRAARVHEQQHATMAGWYADDDISTAAFVLGTAYRDGSPLR